MSTPNCNNFVLPRAILIFSIAAASNGVERVHQMGSDSNKETISCQQTRVSPHWMKLLVPSLFKNVPPTIRFVRQEECVNSLPEVLKLELNWGMTKRTGDKKITENVISRTGINLVNQSEENGQLQNNVFGFFDRFDSSNINEDKQDPTYPKPWTKINHLPGIFELDNKIRLHRKQQRMVKRFGLSHLPFLLPSFEIPTEMVAFKSMCSSDPQALWVQKQANMSRSIGIRFFNGCENVSTETTLVQKYVKNPLTIDGKKLEFRKYVLITGVDPFRIFTLDDERLKVSIKPFTTDVDQLSDLCVHTPGNLACQIPGFEQPQCRLSSEMTSYFKRIGLDVNRVREEMDDAIIKTVLSAQRGLTRSYYRKVHNRYNAFNLMAFDFFVDTNGKLWLNEVNRRPLLSEHAGKNSWNVVASAFTIAGFNLPPIISSEARKLILFNWEGTHPLVDPTFDPQLYSFNISVQDRAKWKRFSNGGDIMGILENLTAAEIRLLTIAEDELNRQPPEFNRIFPSSNMKRYLEYVTYKPYNYFLFNAWEEMYGQENGNRTAGITRLNSF